MAEPITLLNQNESDFLQRISALSDEEKQKFFNDNPEVRSSYDDIVKKLEVPRTPLDYDPTTFQSSIQKTGKVLKGVGSGFEKVAEKLPVGVKLGPSIFDTKDLLNAYSNFFGGVGGFLDDEEKLRKAADIGVDVNTTGGDLLRRFKAGFGSRNLSFEDTKKLITEQIGKEPYYMEDIEGVGVAFQANKGDQLVAFNRPGADAGDIIEFIGEEALPLSLDIATQIVLTQRLGALPKNTVGKVLGGGTTAVASGFATYVGELGKLYVGQQLFGLNQDKSFTDFMEESIQPAALAGAGTAAFNLIGSFSAGLYRAFNEGKIPNEVLNEINRIVEKAKKDASDIDIPKSDIPGFKPTLGQRLRSPELLVLEEELINAPGASQLIKDSYDKLNRDNNESIFKFAEQVADEFGLDVANKSIDDLARAFKELAGEKSKRLKDRVLQSYQLSRSVAGTSVKNLDGYRGAAGDLGFNLMNITNKSVDELTDGDTVLNTLLQNALKQSDDIFESVKNAVGVLPAKQNEIVKVISKFIDDPGEKSLFKALDEPSFVSRVFDNPKEAQGLLLRLKNRSPDGRFAPPLDLKELIATRKFLNQAKGGKKDIELDVREINQMIKAIDKDIQSSLKVADETGNTIPIRGEQYLPSEAWSFANNTYKQANDLARKQFISEIKQKRILPSQLFDMTLNKSVRGARANEYFDDIYDLLKLGDENLITDLRFSFGERLKNVIANSDIPNRAKAVDDFLELHNGIFKKLYPTKTDQRAFRIAARDLDNVAKAKINYENALKAIDERFNIFTGGDDEVITNIYKIFKGTTDENLIQLTAKRRQLVKFLNQSPELKNEFQHHLRQIILRDITKQDPFYGPVIDGDSLINIIQDPNFEKSYNLFFDPKYITNLKKLADTIQFSNKQIQNKISREARNNAKEIVRTVTTPFSEGQQAAQGILGPLNPISVKFRIYDKIQLERGFRTLNNMILDEELLDSFIKNRFNTFKNIKRATPIGALYARNYEDIMSDDEIPDEVRLLAE